MPGKFCVFPLLFDALLSRSCPYLLLIRNHIPYYNWYLFCVILFILNKINKIASQICDYITKITVCARLFCFHSSCELPIRFHFDCLSLSFVWRVICWWRTPILNSNAHLFLQQVALYTSCGSYAMESKNNCFAPTNYFWWKHFTKLCKRFSSKLMRWKLMSSKIRSETKGCTAQPSNAAYHMVSSGISIGET